MLFSQQGAFSNAALKDYGVRVGLDAARFNQCVDSSEHLPKVYQDSREGQAQGVTGTPTFFINGQMLTGAVPYAELKAKIEAALATGS